MNHAALSDADRAKIRDAVALAEGRTAGEIFTVVAAESDDYRFVPLLWATLVALLVPLPLVFLTRLPVLQIYLAQLAVFIVLALALSLPRIRVLIVPRGVKHARAHALAVEQFLAHGLHMTKARTGVLIFVSLAERYAEIVADAGIAEKVEAKVWVEAMDKLLAEVKAGRLAEGLVAAIGHTGDVLAAHFPRKAGDRNELPNDLILL
jgi:putative membrane protein